MTKSNYLYGFGLCLLLSACGPGKYYSPVNNRLGTARPLSKTNDVIAVLVPYKIQEMVKKARSDDKDWSIFYNHTMDIGMAKIYTENRLKELGYRVVNDGLHPKNDGHPNVIALVEANRDTTKDDTVVRTYQTPLFTDTNGNPELWKTNADVFTYKYIDYNVRLVRPAGRDNELFKCNHNSLSLDFCIAPVHPSNYETIFEGFGSMNTNANNSAYILDHITTAVWYNYPNMIGQYKAWLYTFPDPNVGPKVIKTEHNHTAKP